jgi:hypothetical protein
MTRAPAGQRCGLFARWPPMNEVELEQCRALLGVTATATTEELERAFMKKNFTLIKGNTGDEPKQNVDIERQRLRTAHEKLAEHLKTQVEAAAKGPKLPPPPGPNKSAADAVWQTNRAAASPTLSAPPVVTPRDPAADELAVLRFDHWGVNVLVPPLLLGLAWAANVSPLGFLLRGFHVWMHEFGHATAAWLCGFRATPLPFGWTPVEPVHSHFVYGGLLILFGLLFTAGWKERKIWPMIFAVLLVGVQFYMTWILSDYWQEFWWGAFGGVGGEFYLSTLCMMFFWVQLPDKFRWGLCRHVFFFIGAAAFLNIWLRWRDVYRGIEEIPFGSMINGEGDQGGDMNRLMDGFGWTKFQIRRNYLLLGYGCWAALAIAWAVFALRLNKVADRLAGKLNKAKA